MKHTDKQAIAITHIGTLEIPTAAFPRYKAGILRQTCELIARLHQDDCPDGLFKEVQQYLEHGSNRFSLVLAFLEIEPEITTLGELRARRPISRYPGSPEITKL
jgi:hypothetical protein